MRLIICGVGALGSHTAMLCREFGVTLRFIDCDRVESKNLASQAFVKASLGKNKAEALRLQLKTFYGLTAESRPVRLVPINSHELLEDGDVLVDAFDNLASRQCLSDYARSRGKPLLHGALAADGRFGLVRWDERFVPDAEDRPGQVTCETGEHLPLISLVASVIARTLQDYLEDGTRRDSQVNLKGVVDTTA